MAEDGDRGPEVPDTISSRERERSKASFCRDLVRTFYIVPTFALSDEEQTKLDNYKSTGTAGSFASGTFWIDCCRRRKSWHTLRLLNADLRYGMIGYGCRSEVWFWSSHIKVKKRSKKKASSSDPSLTPTSSPTRMITYIASHVGIGPCSTNQGRPDDFNASM